MWVGLSLRDKKAAQLHALLCLNFITKAQRQITNFKSSDAIGHWSHAHLFFMHWFDTSISKYIFLNLVHTDISSTCFLIADLQSNPASRVYLDSLGLLCLLGHLQTLGYCLMCTKKSTCWIYWTSVLRND